MRNNKNGFTLVELLAVIVILAILILLSFPAVLKIMDTTKKKAFKTEALSLLEAAEIKVSTNESSGNINENVNCINYNELKNDLEGYVKFKNGYYGVIYKDKEELTINVSNGKFQIIGLTKKNKNAEKAEKANLSLSQGDFYCNTINISIEYAQISGGSGHSLAIDKDGNLYAWGDNMYGQIGDGTSGWDNYIKKNPVYIMSDIIAIAGGYNHSLAINKSGNLYAWGSNGTGQLGNGSTENITTPIQVARLKKFKAIAAGRHSLAIDESNDLYAWGNNNYGQLGNGNNENQTIPIQIKEGTKFYKISANFGNSLAIDENGNLYSWGGGELLGNGTINQSNLPVQIVVGTKFKEISAGYNHNLAIDESGNLYTWGLNESGQLGDGTTETSTIPIPIMSGTEFKKIANGVFHSLAIDKDGNLYVWGDCDSFQLSNGISLPTKIMNEIKFKDIAAGDFHSLAIDESGNLYTWGYNSFK